MKKKIIVSILVILITFTFNIYKVNANNELNIDHDSLKSSKNEAYMSVPDMYGIDLFTDKVTKTKQEISNKQKQNRKDLYNSIFLSKVDAKSIRDKKFSKNIEAYSLFAQPSIQKKIEYKKEDSSINIITISVIIFLCMLTGISTRLYYINKRRREEKRSEYNDYTGF
ncbi:hypothetical protein HBE96_15770 [Clostridium sp. P21]|uniref:ESAT-6 secretion machinery protein EssA n=1 Tax=Clostridium muellerianum TaxID=2716538 RepID=A0A7Y0EIH1_9CLOT|nr:hypothetical protein [Clostridium muellerianum]NMM64099.1 hypothetical protein [Clostridium muellerianum]